MAYKQIPLTQGKVTIVDEADYNWLMQWKWCFGDRYAIRTPCVDGVRGSTIRMHRIIMQTPNNMDTDHINGDTLDNRRCNLRVVTHHQNSMNQKSVGGSSKFKGVSWHKTANKWIAYITINGEMKHLGYFHKEADAAHAYNKSAIELYGEYARINPIA